MSAVQEAAGDYIGNEVDFQRRLREMQLWGYAMAVGLPCAPPSGPPGSPNTTITNSVTNPPSPPPLVPPAAAKGLSGLAKAAIAAAAVAGGGGLVAGGALLTGLLNKPAPIVVPTSPSGQVTIGINPDGTLYDPNKLSSP